MNRNAGLTLSVISNPCLIGEIRVYSIKNNLEDYTDKSLVLEDK